MNDYNDFFEKLLSATSVGAISWEDISSTCFISEYEGLSFIICQYFSIEHGKEIGTFRKLNNDGMAIESSRIVWDEKSPEWAAFYKLFQKLEEIYVV